MNIQDDPEMKAVVLKALEMESRRLTELLQEYGRARSTVRNMAMKEVAAEGAPVIQDRLNFMHDALAKLRGDPEIDAPPEE